LFKRYSRDITLDNFLFIEYAEGWDICLKLRDAGLLTRPAHGQIIRISPPLTITEEQLREGINILTTVLKNYR